MVKPRPIETVEVVLGEQRVEQRELARDRCQRRVDADQHRRTDQVIAKSACSAASDPTRIARAGIVLRQCFLDASDEGAARLVV